MKRVTVLPVVLAVSLCGCGESVAPAGVDGVIATTSVAPTSSTTMPEETTVTSEPSTSVPDDMVPDLSGIWDGVLSGQTRPQSGTVLISQSESAFTLQFSEGFECQPAEACDFDGIVETIEDEDGVVVGYSWMAANSGVADDEGGTFESQFRLQQAIDPEDLATIPDVYEGPGHSEYHGPSGDIAWDTYVVLTRRG